MWGMALPGSVAVPVRSRTGLPVCHRGAPVCAVVVTSSSSPQGSAGQPGRPGPPGHRGQAVSRGNPPREGVGGCWVRGRHPLRMGCAGSDPAVFPQGLPGQPGSKGGPGDKVGVGLSPQPRPPPVSPSCVPLPSCSPFGAGGDRDPMLSASVCPQGEVGARGQPGITGAPGQLVSKDPNDPPQQHGAVFSPLCAVPNPFGAHGMHLSTLTAPPGSNPSVARLCSQQPPLRGWGGGHQEGAVHPLPRTKGSRWHPPAPMPLIWVFFLFRVNPAPGASRDRRVSPGQR